VPALDSQRNNWNRSGVLQSCGGLRISGQRAVRAVSAQVFQHFAARLIAALPVLEQRLHDHGADTGSIEDPLPWRSRIFVHELYIRGDIFVRERFFAGTHFI